MLNDVMNRVDQYTYDAIIIGAGIGGLVCGCFLAKAGLRVLIIEQHHSPGGYCTSFQRMGFQFDAAAHSIGGFQYGNLSNIFKDLGLTSLLQLNKADPANIVLTPDFEIRFWSDIEKTIDNLQKYFPAEKKYIKTFYHDIVDKDKISSLPLRNLSFQEFLNKFFTNAKLKAILSTPILGNSGLPPSKISAFMGIKIFQEYIIDGGYYLVEGMQSLPNALVSRFREHGGELLLSTRVMKISIVSGKVDQVITDKGIHFGSKYIVSNCDSRQTFLDLLGKDNLPNDFIDTIDKMTHSLSIFKLFLGLDECKTIDLSPGSNIWVLSHYDLFEIYKSASNQNFVQAGLYLFYLSHDKKSAAGLLLAPFLDKAYWNVRKKEIMRSFIQRISRDLIPNLHELKVYKEAATPYTLYRYTSNYNGAAFGWECTRTQLALSEFRKPSFIKGLYFSGHWATKGLGIAGVAYIGLDTAKMILKKEKAIHSSMNIV